MPDQFMTVPFSAALHGLALNFDCGSSPNNDCLRRIEYIRSEHVGFSMITLFSTPEGESLYRRNGFDYAEEDMYMAKEEDDGKTKAMYRPVDVEYI